MTDRLTARCPGKEPRLIRAALGILLLAVAAPAAPAASARDELLRFVPRSAGFCLVVQDLRAHVDALLASPFSAFLRETRLGQTLREGDELTRLARLSKQVEALLGMSVEEIHQQVLGDAIVFVFRPGPPDQPEQEQGLLMIRAGSAAALKGLLDRINQLQRSTGELVEIEERTHHGVRYHRRVERRKQSFMYLRGPILLLTSQEAILRDALDAEAASDPEASPVVARSLAELGAEKAVVAFWINPRAFDEAVAAHIENTRASAEEQRQAQQMAVLSLFQQCWKALDAAAITLSVDTEARLALSLKGNAGQLPHPLRDLMSSLATPTLLWQAPGERTILALGSQVRFPALLEALEHLLPPDQRDEPGRVLERSLGAALGRDASKEVLPALGPGWMVWLASPPREEKAWLPEIFFALQVDPGNPEAPLDRAILEAIHSFAMLGVVSYNQQHPMQLLRWRRQRLAGQDIRYLESDRLAPLGILPALTLHDGYLLAASSPSALGRLVSVVKTLKSSTPVPAEATLARLSVDGLRSYLEDQEPHLARGVAASHQLPLSEAREKLQQLDQALELLRSVELKAHSAPGRATLTLSLRAARSLR